MSRRVVEAIDRFAGYGPIVMGMATAAALRTPTRPAPRFGFGDRLRLVRRDLGKTQAEMAMHVGAGLKSYSSWESGQSRPADLADWAERLELRTGIGRAWWLGWGEGDAASISSSDGYASYPGLKVA